MSIPIIQMEKSGNGLTEHHRIYDHPDDYETQKRWLLRAGFREIDIGWNDGYWMYFTATK